MNAQEVLKDADLSALQADRERTICLVATLAPGCFLDGELTDAVRGVIAETLKNTKWADVPIFVLEHGAKLEAVVADPAKLKEQEDTAVLMAINPEMYNEIVWTCSHAPGKFYTPEAERAAQNIIDIFKKRLELTKLWLIGEGSGRPWHLHVTQMDNGWSIGLRTCGVMCPTPSEFGNAHFDVSIIGDTFYLLDIELVKHLRGRGYGSEMYETLEQIARDLNCKRIEQTPSGIVSYKGDHKKETRMEWLLRRGWVLGRETHGPDQIAQVAYKIL